MTDNEYKEKMDMLVHGLQIGTMTGLSVTNEDLKVMQKTISIANSAGFLFVKPFDLGETDKQLKRQQKVIDIHRQLRELFDEEDYG